MPGRCGSCVRSPGQAAAAVQPGDGALHNPALWPRHELGSVRPLDDLDVDLAAHPGNACLELRPGVAIVGVELEQERVEIEQGGHH